MRIFIISSCVVIPIIVILLLVRSHIKWLDRQNPADVWITDYDGASITLQFEEEMPGKKEGIYKQITKSAEGKEVKEFGHWVAHRNELRMIMMACDIANHPLFGQDTINQIDYVGPDSISIYGPNRPSLVFERAPKGTTIKFPDKKPSSK